eukprot:129533_1
MTSCCSITKLFSKKTVDHKEIEKRMKMEKDLQKKRIRILILGPGDSGKTTILKQMKKINHIHDDSDCVRMTAYIKDAIVGYMKTLCYQSEILYDEHDEKTLINDNLEELRNEIMQLQAPYNLTKDLAKKIKILWSDNGIKETLNQRHHYQIPDNVEYFFNKIDKVATEKYIPSFADYLRIRSTSTGFAQTNITANIDKFGQHTFEFTDVGGQRSERKKWMRFISEDIDAVLYVIALSDYDLKLWEDDKTNRLVEAINLFREIMIKGNFFTNKSVLLFFNRYTLFKEKIKKIPITVAFDDFPTSELNPNDEDDVVRFIAGKFLQVFEDQNINLAGPLHIIRTDAEDTDNIDKVFRDITLDLVKQNLRNYGIK